MGTLLVGAISVFAFSSFTMAINSWIDFTNKDFKREKGSIKEVEIDGIEGLRKELTK